MNLALNPFDSGKRPEIVLNTEIGKGIYDVVKNEVLEPKQIGDVLQKMFEEKMHPNAIGYGVSNLVQSSFNHGYNDFELHINGKIGMLLSHMDGSSKDVLDGIRADVYGHCGLMFGFKSRHIIATVHGDAGPYFAEDMWQSLIQITGKVECEIGNGSEYSTYILHKKLSVPDYAFAAAKGVRVQSYSQKVLDQMPHWVECELI